MFGKLGTLAAVPAQRARGQCITGLIYRDTHTCGQFHVSDQSHSNLHVCGLWEEAGDKTQGDTGRHFKTPTRGVQLLWLVNPSNCNDCLLKQSLGCRLGPVQLSLYASGWLSRDWSHVFVLSVHESVYGNSRSFGTEIKQYNECLYTHTIHVHIYSRGA